LGGVLTDDSSVDNSGKIIISSNNVGRWQWTEVAVTTEAAVEPAARYKRRLVISSNGILTNDGSFGSISGMTISSSNGGRWRWTAAAASTESSGRAG